MPVPVVIMISIWGLVALSYIIFSVRYFRQESKKSKAKITHYKPVKKSVKSDVTNAKERKTTC